ncbi:MAG: FAD:protein FMN transferase [Bradymonadia bacterium]|jgi:thiamine biosynthesis lipoprotein
MRFWSTAATLLVSGALLLLLWWLFWGPQALPEIERVEMPFMGKELVIEVLPQEGGVARARAALIAAMRQAESVEALMSDNNQNSEIARLNAAAAGEQVILSADTLTLLMVAKRYYADCAHSFDITLAPIIDQWIEAQARQELPSKDVLNAIRQDTDWQSFIFDNDSVRKKNDLSRLNLSAIAKGYAIDRVVHALKTAGLQTAKVQIDGNMRVFGTTPKHTPQQAYIVNPFDNSKTLVRYIVQNAGVGTSGNRARYMEIKQRKYSHIIDPRTLMPSRQRASVTVVASSALAADVWATALAVLGVTGLKELPDDVAAFMILGDEDSMQLVCNENFAKLLITTPSELQIYP